MNQRSLGLFLLLCLASLGACKPEDQETGSVNKEEMQAARSKLPETVRMHVDSGNAYYRLKDYPRALSHFQAAVAEDDDQVAAWFGIYMTQLALGNAAAADSALKRAQKAAPGATLIHPKSNAQ